MGRLIEVAFIISITRIGSESIQAEPVETWEENGEIIPMVETIDMG